MNIGEALEHEFTHLFLYTPRQKKKKKFHAHKNALWLLMAAENLLRFRMEERYLHFEMPVLGMVLRDGYACGGMPNVD